MNCSARITLIFQYSTRWIGFTGLCSGHALENIIDIMIVLEMAEKSYSIIDGVSYDEVSTAITAPDEVLIIGSNRGFQLESLP